MMARRELAVRDREEMRLSGGLFVVHVLPLLLPAAAWLILGAAMMGANKAWGPEANPHVTPIISVIFLILMAGLTAFGWSINGKARTHLRVAVVISGVAGTVNLILGLTFWLFQGWMITVFILSGLPVWGVWVVWRLMRYAGATETGDGSGGNDLLHAIKSAKVRFSKPTVDERGVVRAKVHTTPGGTLEDARTLIPLLAAEGKAVRGSAQLIRDPDVDGIAEFEMATVDNLKDGVPWRGVEQVGVGSLPTDWFSVGQYQTEECLVRIVGEEDDPAGDIKHLKIGGVTGSGKSNAALVFLTSLLLKRRLNIIGIDLTKGMQTLGLLAHGLTWVLNDPQDVEQFLARLPHVIKGRGDQLAREGLRRWSLRSKLDLMVVWIEESKAMRRYQSRYEALAADARSAGIWLVSSTQDWLWRNVSTSARKSHTAGICFGMTEADDVQTILPPEAVQALGKDGLPLWGSDKPGYCYISGLGIPPTKWARFVRFAIATDEQILQAVEVGAPYRSPMDPITADLFGELFARRTIYTGPQWGGSITSKAVETVPARLVSAPQPATRPTMPAAPLFRGPQAPWEDPDDDLEEDLVDASPEEAARRAAEYERREHAEMLARLEESRRRNLGEDLKPGDFADIDPTIPLSMDIDDDGQEEEDNGPEIEPEEARRIFDTKLDELYRAGARRVETSHLVAWTEEVRRHRTYLYGQVKRWRQAGLVEEDADNGGWLIVGSPLETIARAPGSPHGT
ncbi:hypothetical protein ACIBHX_46610 [Nonomuraea sp. NPDC050536]|uniref:hypothetical protein n=1 Tax=Nonomuraea sp. NPDC050536 TaxID=3364366 RepID=UPI0037C57497